MATKLEPAQSPGSPWKHISWAAVAALIGFLLVTGPLSFVFGRLWAEEASDFLPALIDRDFGSASFFTYRGSLQLPTNWAVWVAARFALLHAPMVTFWTSIAALLLLAGMVGWWARRLAIPPQIAALGFFAFLMVQSVEEVIGTSTNLQWLLSLCTLLLLIMPEDALRRGLPWHGALMAIAGLCGVPSCMLTPAFLARALVERSRAHAFLGAILVVASFVQIWILLTSSLSGRSFDFNPGLFLFSLVLHLALIFLPSDLVHHIGVAFLDGNARWAIVFVATMLGIAAVLGVGRMARSGGRSDFAPFRLIALGVFVTFVNLFGAHGETYRMVLAPLDGRYFVFMIFCMILLLMVSTRSERSSIRDGAVLLLVLAAGIGASRHVGTLLARPPQPPLWADQIAACRSQPDRICHLQTLPAEGNGTFWRTELPGAALTEPKADRSLP